jgi:hypothetical protein
MTASTLSEGAPRVARGRPFPPNHPWDRNFFLLWVLLTWFGVLSGFGPEVFQHIAKHEKPFPPIVHVHGVAFMGWLTLTTVQVLLIRTNRRGLHRRLGAAMVLLAAAMLVIGPATAWVMDRVHQADPDPDPGFILVQMTDMLAFALFAGAGILLRNSASAHKRLMLMATLYISDAGWARFLGDGIQHAFGKGELSHLASLYFASDLLMLGIGLYDLITRRRVHPAWLAAIAWVAVSQPVIVHLLGDPAWKITAQHLIGY